TWHVLISSLSSPQRPAWRRYYAPETRQGCVEGLRMEQLHSAVANGVRIRKKVLDMTGLNEVFSDVNVTLVVKSSPEKCVPLLSEIASHEGKVLKLNDSDQWRERYALLVPHTFLYYFDKMDPRPRGIIDMQRYSRAEILDENTVRLAPDDDILPLRSFYFKFDNPEEARSWARSMNTNRFDQERQEKERLECANATLLRQVTLSTSNASESRAAIAVRNASAAMSELAGVTASNAQHLAQVEALLAVATGRNMAGQQEGAAFVGGEREVSMSLLSGLTELGEAIEGLRSNVLSLKVTLLINQTTCPATALLKPLLQHVFPSSPPPQCHLLNPLPLNPSTQEENALLLEGAEAEEECRRVLKEEAEEALLEERQLRGAEATARATLEQRLASCVAELEGAQAKAREAQANLGVVAAACRECEARAQSLQEQRRVLVCEVKSARAERARLAAALGDSERARALAEAATTASMERALAAKAALGAEVAVAREVVLVGAEGGATAWAGGGAGAGGHTGAEAGNEILGAG
ncbi:unnamed protein product, partial [Discosporangium mesarthrocarpum]